MLSAVVAVALSAAVQLSPALSKDSVKDDLWLPSNRPISTYIPVDANTAPARMYAEGQPFLLYMNRHAASYACGDDDASRNFSSIACEAAGGVAEMTGFSGTDAQWQDIMGCLTDLFAPFRLAVTDVEPTSGEYVEAVIGGTPNQAGMGFGVGGVAPFGCGLIPGAVVYAFADVYGNDARGICETAAQEVAHAFGLDHEFLCEDPLTYLSGCGEKSFQDNWAPCGEFEPRQCTCGGTTQNSVQAMLEMFGAADGTVYTPPVDNGPPVTALIEPNDGEILDAFGTIIVRATASDDAGLTAVQLEWGITGDVLFCPIATNDYTCTKTGDEYTWRIEDTAGSRPFRVRVRDVAGNETVTEDRRVWLSRDGSGPPKDVGPPVVLVGSPLPGAVIPTETVFDVVATIMDDNDIALAEMNWPRRGQDFWIPCPYEDERVSCGVEGNTYRWAVQSRREGDRFFQIRVVDVLGNTTLTEEIGITLTPGAVLPETNGGDTFDEARVVGCGETFEVRGGSADWFAVDAAQGDTVSISVGGAEVGGLVATDGNGVTVQGSSSGLELQATPGVRVGVMPSTTDAALEVAVTCTPPPEPPAPASCTGGASSGLVVALLALLRRRRG